MKKHNHTRRILLKNATGDFTLDDIFIILKQQNYNCAICKKLFPQKENGDYIYSIDHIVPISKFGTNNHDNLQLLCKSCNSSKNNKIDKTNIRTYLVAETVPEIKMVLNGEIN
jgi:5-methylcytosine-specific restriction endonuclease McrA